VVADILIAVAIGYLLGAIPFGLIISKRVKGIDVREYGSGSTGFTNSLRTIGWKPALAVMVLDIAKGAAATLLAGYLLGDSQLYSALAGASAVIGHVWPVYVGFRGGRGVATGFGALLALVPIVALIVLPVGLAIVVLSRYVSLMSLTCTIVAAALVTALALMGHEGWATILFGVLSASLIVYQHRGNIKRLLSGTEPKIGQGGIRRQPGGAGGRP
jgi:glycerol-3-phosphate acyltransferase PlsY